MKKLLTITALACAVLVMAPVFMSCDIQEEEEDTKLKISNQSSFALTDISWRGGKKWNTLPGSAVTLSVDEGSAYIYFTKGRIISKSGDYYTVEIVADCRTQDLVTVSKNENKAFTFTGNTLVVVLDDSTNTVQTLGEVQ